MEKTIYRIYSEQIKKFPLLSPEQEKELVYKIRDGDEKARQTLINSNLRLVVSIAFKYTGSAVSAMDIIQEGNMGLMTAVAKFDPSFNTRFSTYAYVWIMQHISRYIHLKTSAIPLPAMKEELMRTVMTACDELYQHFHREPTVQELAIFLNMEEAVVQNVLQYKYTVVSLDEKVGQQGKITFSDLLTDCSPSAEAKILNQVIRQEYEKLIGLLPDREKFVLLSKYRAYINGEKLTLRQISYKLGVSCEAVRQIELRSHAKMRKILEKHKAVL